MDDKNWKKFTETGTEFWQNNRKCCAYRFYQSALSEAEQLLMHSYEINEEVPVIPVIIISYQNLVHLLDSELCSHDIDTYLARSTARLTGVLNSPEFPPHVQKSCCENIHKLYYLICEIGEKYPKLSEDCETYLELIKQAVYSHLQHSRP